MFAGAGLPTTAQRGVGRAQIAAGLLAAALVGVGLGVGSHFLLTHAEPSSAPLAASVKLHGEATWAAGARPAPPIATLSDQSGRRFSLASLRGRTVAMVFFDSHCGRNAPWRAGR